MENHLFKTSSFAALCGVKKDTLLHYDHIGLLQPHSIGENGYRYYASSPPLTPSPPCAGSKPPCR